MTSDLYLHKRSLKWPFWSNLWVLVAINAINWELFGIMSKTSIFVLLRNVSGYCLFVDKVLLKSFLSLSLFCPFQAFKHNLDKLICFIFLFYCLNFWFWHSHSNLTCFAMLTFENDLMRVKVCWERCAACFQKHMGCKSSQ